MKRIAVTGANGFVGTGLINRLLREPDFTAVEIVRSKGCVGTSNRIAVGSIDATTDWKNALDQVDVIVHLAGRAHVLRDTVKDPMAAFREANVVGLRRLVEGAQAAGVKQLIFMSSIGVNGAETTDRPFSEQHPPDPQSFYAASKLEAEEMLRVSAQEAGLRTTIIRPPLIYGPDAPGNFGRLVALVRGGMPLPLATLRNRRSFISRDNLVDFTLACIANAQAFDETFLVSDGEDFSTTDLVRTIASGMGKPARLWPFPGSILRAGLSALGRKTMARQLCGSLQIDISKARTQLGWQPPQSFAAGIHAAVGCA